MRNCKRIGLDPAIYFTETDPLKNAIRDAAASVLYQDEVDRAEEAERRRQR